METNEDDYLKHIKKLVTEYLQDSSYISTINEIGLAQLSIIKNYIDNDSIALDNFKDNLGK